LFEEAAMVRKDNRRTERLRKTIDRVIERGSSKGQSTPGPEKPGDRGKESPRDFIRRRMAELDRREE
jgi:hypothetical protein